MREEDRKVVDYNECGVPCFRGGGGRGDSKGRDPFELSLSCEFQHLRDKQQVINVHDDLYIARTIAESIFAKHWEAHVLEIYDRLVAERARSLEAS